VRFLDDVVVVVVVVVVGNPPVLVVLFCAKWFSCPILKTKHYVCLCVCNNIYMYVCCVLLYICCGGVKGLI
jgi:hypothetical protein